MIKLTDVNGKATYFQPESIVCVEESNTTHYTRIWIGSGEDDYKNVQELPEEVAKKVLEYKLLMKRYNAAAISFEMAEDMTEAVSDAEHSMMTYKERINLLAGLDKGEK